MTRTPRLLLLPAPILLLFGCAAEPSPFAGRWEGTITEGQVSVDVLLEFSADRPPRGTLTLLSDPRTELDKGRAIALVEVREEGDRLGFVLPITGKVDPDSTVADLRLEGDRLAGTFRENREGSKAFPVEFRRVGG